MNRLTLALFASTLTLVLGGCRGEDISFDCEIQREAFVETTAEEGRVLAGIPEAGPYPIRMTLTEEGVNRLVKATVSENAPFSDEMPFGALRIRFDQKTCEQHEDCKSGVCKEALCDPVVRFDPIEGCSTCVAIFQEFDFQITDGSTPFNAGIGNAKLLVPLELQREHDDLPGKPPVGQAGIDTTLIANFPQAVVDELTISLSGFSSEEYTAVTGALQVLTTENVQENFDPVALMTFGDWRLGNDNVKLAARELVVSPERRTLELGLHTNLLLPDDAGLDPAVELPEDVHMRLSFDHDVLLVVSQLMLREGTIPRMYDNDGNPDPDGNHGVTLDEFMNIPGDVNKTTIDSRFRVWRIDEGYCGFARVMLPLHINQNDAGIGVIPDAITVLSGEGSGAIAADDEDLVRENAHLVDQFRQSLAEQVGFALDYEQLSLDGRTIVTDAKGAIVEEAGVNLDTDFFVVLAEEP